MKGIDAKYQKDNIPLPDRPIHCNMIQSIIKIRDCKSCLYRDNCRYRENGAMRRIKIDWDSLIG